MSETAAELIVGQLTRDRRKASDCFSAAWPHVQTALVFERSTPIRTASHELALAHQSVDVFLRQLDDSDQFFDRIQMVENVLRSPGGVDELRGVQIDAHVVIHRGVNFLVIHRSSLSDLAFATGSSNRLSTPNSAASHECHGGDAANDPDRLEH